MIKKVVSFDSTTKVKIIKGALRVSDIVGRTLGPSGRNALIYKKYKSPPITNDGVTIARHIVLEDEIEDLGAQVMVEACMKTNKTVGDGTTTTAVIAGALIRSIEEQSKSVVQDRDVIALSRLIDEQAKVVIEKINEKSHPLSGDDLTYITSTSMRDKNYGKIIADVISQVGKDGYVSVEDNWLTQYGVTTEIVIGMRKLADLASPYFINTKHKEAKWENTNILICNDVFKSGDSIGKLLNEILNDSNKNLVIVNGSENPPYPNEFVVSVLNTILMRQKGNTKLPNILLVKAPALTSEELEDMAVFCDAKFIDRHKGMKLEKVTMTHSPSDLGYAEKVVVTEDEIIITGGRGKKDERIKLLNEHMELERDPMFKEKLKRRIAGMADGQGIIRVGAATEQERTYLKDKIEDAKCAAKAAMEEGVVKGGGLTLKEIAEELGEDNILYGALLAPYQKIRENAGTDILVDDTILDATKVTRLAVQNACSVVSKLITAEIAIGEKIESPWDKFDKVYQKLIPMDNGDYRSDENQDLNL